MNNRKNMLPRAEEPAAEPALKSGENGISQAVKEKDNQHNRDISSKTVFGNAVLCAQFLRDNLNMPALRDVQPESFRSGFPISGMRWSGFTITATESFWIGEMRCP